MFSSDAQRVLQSVWRVQIIHGQSIGSVPAAHHDDPLRSKGNGWQQNIWLVVQ
jgi:hypothetical protein